MEEHVHDRSNSWVQALSRGNRSWAATELRLNNDDNHTRSRYQANSSGDSAWVATGMRMYGQANCTLAEPPDEVRCICCRAETEHHLQEYPSDLYLLTPWDYR